MFLGKDGVLRKRREEVAKQVGPILDELTQEYEKAIKRNWLRCATNLVRERARSDGTASPLSGALALMSFAAMELRCGGARDLDRVTTSALLRIDGRERLARSVVRATRVPGVCILAEFDDAGSRRLALPARPWRDARRGQDMHPGGQSASALSYMLGLVDAPVRLTKADEASAVLVIEADLPTAITETWAAGLTAHVDRLIRIETTQRASES